MSTLCFDILNTPIGAFTIVVSETGALKRIDFGPPSAHLIDKGRQDESRCAEAMTQLADYFGGKRRAFDLPLAPEGTPFQQRVWQALSDIPFGKTMSYGELASLLDNPKASRAVGSANGANPIPIVIPCHRVIASDGTLGGYAGGLGMKRYLLDLEGALETDLFQSTTSSEIAPSAASASSA